MKMQDPDHIISALEKVIHTRFKKKHYAHEAICHKSYAYDGRAEALKHNERLEFLGDAVLGMLITDELFRKLKDYQEGELSVIKSTLIRRETLAMLARTFNLGSFLLLSKGEENSGGRARDSILANALESLIGAIFLDRGVRVVKKFILTLFKELLEKIPSEVHLKEYKNLFQEMSHIKFKVNPTYQITSETGPDHQKLFEAVVTVHGEIFGRGTGHSKKEAEKNAAKVGYEKILKMNNH